MKSQFGTSNLPDKVGLRYAPFAFTEQCVAMLSSVLNSKKAIDVNSQIIRIFTRSRQMLVDNTELRLEIEKIKKTLDNQGKKMEVVFQYLDQLLDQKEKPKTHKPIGYKLPVKK